MYADCVFDHPKPARDGGAIYVFYRQPTNTTSVLEANQSGYVHLESNHDMKARRLTTLEIKTKFVDLEWQQRHRLLQGSQQSTSPTDPPSQWSRLSGDVVIARNRYMNVEPYAQNRIKLKVAEGINDYINASPIQLGRRKYIATQGPKDTSVNHFYRMLAAEVQSPAVVVMLTQTHEAGREKCFQYYPLSVQESPMIIPPDEEIQDGFKGEVHLESVEEDARSRSQVRKLRLRTSMNDAEVRDIDIQHLLFSAWPDFLIPEGDDRAALIELIHLSAVLNHEKEPADTTNLESQTNGANGAIHTDVDQGHAPSPRIIHCSAGVGRSGTFIALDYLLSVLASGQLDDIPPDKDPIVDTVDLLRQQRMMMVQGEAQFQFLYEVLKETMVGRMQSQDAAAQARV